MWPCQAPNIFCNGLWNQQNGCDELNCPSSDKSFCANNEHSCAYFNSTIMGCLPLMKAGDYRFDCLFGTDERITLLKHNFRPRSNPATNLLEVHRYYILPCWNYFNITIEPRHVCDRRNDCPLGDDELFCDWHQNSVCHKSTEFTCKNGTCISKAEQWCNGVIDCAPEGEDERLCTILKTQSVTIYSIHKEPYLPFSFDRFIPTERPLILRKNKVQCHQGIVIHNQVTNTDECLCPPSYYGGNCERQSERLTVFYRVDIPPSFDRGSIHRLVFYLLDDDGEVLTYETMIHTIFNEQFSFKFLIYLSYPRFLQDYSTFNKKFVRIDAYPVTNTSVELSFLSWLYSVQFSDFLPVTRLAAHLYFEEPSPKQAVLCRNFSTCKHGVCQVYVNSGEPFCHCKDGWLGSMCDQEQSTDLCIKLNCSRGFSRCVIYNNYAFCLCALGRMGPKCEIAFDACSSINCRNNGTCISLDERTIPQTCSCPIPYFGNMCQYTSAQLRVNISLNISHIPILIIHFLQSAKSTPSILIHRDFFFFRNVRSNTQVLINHIGQTILPHFIFAQLFDSNSFYGSYYLLVLSNTDRSQLTTELRETHRCPHANEYLNSTLIDAPWLKRIKFYHLYMKNVKSFYDKEYMCLVDKNGFPDCLVYNHNVANCTERNYCQNGGRCLQRKNWVNLIISVCVLNVHQEFLVNLK
jgi:hypothetical protein